MPNSNRANGRANADSAEADSAATKEPSSRARARTRPYTPRYTKSARRPSADRENAFDALAWLVEGATGLIEELRHNDLGLPEDFWVHAYAARQEMLLAVRAVLDDMIEKGVDAAQTETERQKRRERRGGIDIEF
jgi:hypothetical protein